MMTPETSYRERLEQRRATLLLLQRRDHLVANLRLVVFVIGFVTAGLWLGAGMLAPWAWLVPAAAFGALVILHQRVLNAAARVQQAVAYYEEGLRRLSHEWSGRGQHAHPAPPDHPCAVDLDLFGQGSLFELLCTTHTRVGDDVLARWLVSVPDVETVRARQAAVQAMRPGVDRREQQALSAAGQRANLQAERLVGWAGAPPLFDRHGWLQLLAMSLAALSIAGLGLWAFTPWGPWPWIGVLSLQWLVGRLLRPRLEGALGPLEATDARLKVLVSCMAGYERADLGSPLTSAHTQELRGAAGAIATLHQLIVWLDADRNQLFKPFAFMLMWRLQFVLAVERWRARHRTDVGLWLSAFGALEALESLATYAHEHQGDPMPELVPQGPLFEGSGLGHPLLPACVRNDVRLAVDAPVLIVSGSNMSGKSTLLRTVGTNTVLALCGAPVRARALRLSPMAIGATLHIQDSLQRGRSRFFAEITRLKQLADMAQGPLPLLFLLDEVLHGTNSHDRRIGARAVLESLVGRGAVGLVSTHDLALVEVADAVHGRNVHFADDLHGDQLHFDYTLRPGVVQHSNALALMKAVGLSL